MTYLGIIQQLVVTIMSIRLIPFLHLAPYVHHYEFLMRQLANFKKLTHFKMYLSDEDWITFSHAIRENIPHVINRMLSEQYDGYQLNIANVMRLDDSIFLKSKCSHSTVDLPELGEKWPEGLTVTGITVLGWVKHLSVEVDIEMYVDISHFRNAASLFRRPGYYFISDTEHKRLKIIRPYPKRAIIITVTESVEDTVKKDIDYAQVYYDGNDSSMTKACWLSWETMTIMKSGTSKADATRLHSARTIGFRTCLAPGIEIEESKDPLDCRYNLTGSSDHDIRQLTSIFKSFEVSTNFESILKLSDDLT